MDCRALFTWAGKRLDVSKQLRKLSSNMSPDQLAGLLTKWSWSRSSSGALAAILRASQTEGVNFVVSDSRWDISVTVSPVERAVYDQSPCYYCVPTRVEP